MQQQAFAAVEKAEAEEIVVDEGCERSKDDLNRAEIALSLAMAISAPSVE